MWCFWRRRNKERRTYLALSLSMSSLPAFCNLASSCSSIAAIISGSLGWQSNKLIFLLFYIFFNKIVYGVSLSLYLSKEWNDYCQFQVTWIFFSSRQHDFQKQKKVKNWIISQNLDSTESVSIISIPFYVPSLIWLRTMSQFNSHKFIRKMKHNIILVF